GRRLLGIVGLGHLVLGLAGVRLVLGLVDTRLGLGLGGSPGLGLALVFGIRRFVRHLGGGRLVRHLGGGLLLIRLVRRLVDRGLVLRSELELLQQVGDRPGDDVLALGLGGRLLVGGGALGGLGRRGQQRGG